MPITVQPGMSLPVIAGPATPGLGGNSIKVKFAVQAPDFGGAYILLSICIKVRIGPVTIRIYYTRLVEASSQIEIFESILPVGSIIEEIIPTYDVVEVEPS